jgi:hypothetical protein
MRVFIRCRSITGRWLNIQISHSYEKGIFLKIFIYSNIIILKSTQHSLSYKKRKHIYSCVSVRSSVFLLCWLRYPCYLINKHNGMFTIKLTLLSLTSSTLRRVTHSNYKMTKTGNERINVTLRRVRIQLLPWKSNKYYIFWACVCSLGYPARNAHVP